MIMPRFHALLAAALSLGACASGVHATGESDEEAGAMRFQDQVGCKITGEGAADAERHGACTAFAKAIAEAGLADRVTAIAIAVPSAAAAEVTISLASGAAPLTLQFDSMDRDIDPQAWARFAADAAAYLGAQPR